MDIIIDSFSDRNIRFQRKIFELIIRQFFHVEIFRYGNYIRLFDRSFQQLELIGNIN